MMLRLRVMGQSLALGVAEYRTIYTLRSWLTGWIVRMLAQVSFFATIGFMLRSSANVRYLLIGNAVVLVCLEAAIVVLTMAGERWGGTLIALLTTPAQPITVFLGRGINWVFTGVATSTITLALLPPLFGVPVGALRLLACLPILVIIGLTSYAYGSFLAGLTVRWPSFDWLVLNVGYLMVMAFAGVNVPVDYWPAVPRAIAQVLPVTHGLQAIRGLLDGAGYGYVLSRVGLEVLVGVVWLMAASLSYRLFVSHARRRGTLDM